MRSRSWPGLLVLLAAGCLEQAKPQPLPRRPTLYARLGGEPFLERVVNTFVTRLLSSGRDTPHFLLRKEARHLFENGGPALKRELVEELGSLLGGPQPARREKLLEMFRLAGKDDARELEELLADSFAKNEAPPRDVEEVKKVLAELRKEALGKKEER